MTKRALFWGYDLEEPSFRHRMRSLAHELDQRGWQCELDQLPKRRYLRRLLPRLAQVRAVDLLVLHRVKLSPLESAPLRRAARVLVYDVDDAVYFGRPERIGERPDRSWFRQHKFATTCAAADLVLAGNATIAAVAGRRARRVEVVPTPVEVDRYQGCVGLERSPRTLVWIGLPGNLIYLEVIRPVLAALAAEVEGLRLRVVSSRFPPWPEVAVEPVRWSADDEVRSLCTAGIGVMPLPDDDWTRGKCAFKLLQYMAAGLPCVGSAVGANLEVVDQGRSGFLAATGEEWDRALRSLLGDPDRARRMGAMGREIVRRRYDARVVVPHAADLVERLVGADQSSGGQRSTPGGPIRVK